jgi:aldehyde dehydrogenase (NAD+)
MAKTFKNFIAGEWTAPTGGAYFENRNPADTDRPDRTVPRLRPPRSRGGRPLGQARVRALVAHSRAAPWRRAPRVGDLLVERKEAIADAMTREMGKVLAETRGDVQEGIDTAYYAATEGRRLFGRVGPVGAPLQVGDELPAGRSASSGSSRRSTSLWQSRPGRCFPRCSAETR